MAEIRPVSDLQRKLGEITKLAKETKEPVYLTRNGKKHLVLMVEEIHRLRLWCDIWFTRP